MPRRNLINPVSERWRPPVFTPNITLWQKLKMALLRFFDLQAGSIWRDLKIELQNASGTVLDVGCGAQIYRTLLPKHVRYIGIDTSEAKAHFGYEVPDTIYFSGKVWPIDDHSIDLVLCTEVLEHILDSVQFMSEVHRCLRIDGRLIMTVPFAARWHFIPHDYWRYTPSSLMHLLTATGFKKVAVYARGNPLTVACYKTMALLLPLIFPQIPRPLFGAIIRILGILAMPFLFILALIANLSLGIDWGDDCLGYTVIAYFAKESPPGTL